MAFTHTHVQNFQRGSEGGLISKSVTVTADAESNLDVAVPDSSTDLEVAYELDVSVLKSFYLVSDQDVTIETNDGTTPSDVFTLVAGEPLVWWTGSPLPNPFASEADVAALFVTNASGATANLQLRSLQDPTP